MKASNASRMRISSISTEDNMKGLLWLFLRLVMVTKRSSFIESFSFKLYHPSIMFIVHGKIHIQQLSYNLILITKICIRNIFRSSKMQAREFNQCTNKFLSDFIFTKEKGQFLNIKISRFLISDKLKFSYAM